MKLMAMVEDEAFGAIRHHEVTALYFDGYLIGDRPLEGLVVKIVLNASGDGIKIDTKWPKGVNGPFWTEIAKQFALQNGGFSTTPELDNDDGFIEMEETSA